MKKSIYFFLLVGTLAIFFSACSKEQIDEPNKELNFGEIETDSGDLIRCEGAIQLANLDSPFETADEFLSVRAVYNLERSAFDLTIENKRDFKVCNIKIELIMKYGLFLVHDATSNSIDIDAQSTYQFSLADGGVVATGFRIDILTKRSC